jgi:acetoin:2,6-dichlorophenolindophenol oxidoreductase subunit alpha
MSPRKNRPGVSSAAPPGTNGFPLISNDKLIALYTAMLKCRMLEQMSEQRNHGEKTDAAGRPRGCEAVAAGVAIDLESGDKVFAADGGLLAGYIRKGLSKSVLRRLRNGLGEARERAVRASAGALFERSLETARRLKREKTKKVAVLFLGPVAPPAKALRSAAQDRAPILFVCWSEGEERNLAAEADGCGLPGIAVDCEDAVAIYRVASEALAHARRGNGPTLIECKPWLIQARQKTGAVGNMERYLAGKGLFSRKRKLATLAEFRRELDGAVLYARNGRRKKSRAKKKSAE